MNPRMMNRPTTGGAQTCLAAYEDFITKTGTLSAHHFNGRYLVYSYMTIVGFVNWDGHAYILTDRYGPTTGNHVNIIRRAWGDFNIHDVNGVQMEKVIKYGKLEES